MDGPPSPVLIIINPTTVLWFLINLPPPTARTKQTHNTKAPQNMGNPIPFPNLESRIYSREEAPQIMWPNPRHGDRCGSHDRDWVQHKNIKHTLLVSQHKLKPSKHGIHSLCETWSLIMWQIMDLHCRGDRYASWSVHHAPMTEYNTRTSNIL